MQQGARRRHEDAFGSQHLPGAFEALQGRLQVGPPDVAAVDHAQGQVHGRRHAGREHLLQLPGIPHQIQVQGLHGQAQGQLQVVPQALEVGGEEEPQPRRRLGQRGVGPPEGGAGRFVQVEDQEGLVELHPRGAGGLKLPQHLPVHGQEAVEQGEPRIGRDALGHPGGRGRRGRTLANRPGRTGRPARGPRPAAVGGRGRRGAAHLRQQEEADRPQQHRTRLEPQRPGLAELLHHLAGRQMEGLARLQLGHDVVVVRVEPLGHLQGGDALAGRPPGHGEVDVQGHPRGSGGRSVAGSRGPVRPEPALGAGRGATRGGRVARPLRRPAVAGRDGAHHASRVQHVVVEGEVAGRDHVEAGLPLQLPVATPQLGRPAEQLVRRDLAVPVGLEGLLEFPARADAGETQVRRQRHRASPPRPGGIAPCGGRLPPGVDPARQMKTLSGKGEGASPFPISREDVSRGNWHRAAAYARRPVAVASSGPSLGHSR